MTTPKYPIATRSAVADNYHGTLVPDPYRWLETADSAETIAWVAEQGALMNAERETWNTRDGFADRMQQLLGAGTISPP